MATYAESKKALDKIRSKDEIMFRMAISHLMDVGIRHLTEENIAETCKEIAERDDSKAFMTNNYMIDLVIMAGELAKIPHIDLFVYIQREVEYDVGDGSISYKRALCLLKNCMGIIEYSHDDNGYTLDDFEEAGIEEDELEILGFGYLIVEDEEE